MSLSVNKIAFAETTATGNVSSVNSAKKTARNPNLLNNEPIKATVNFTGEKMTDEEKKELILKARTKASGYSFWFGPLSLLYYGLRSNNTIAKKYDLDPQENKKLIQKIKNEQLLWTLPACIPGIHLLSGGVAYLYNKNCDPDAINL